MIGFAVIGFSNRLCSAYGTSSRSCLGYRTYDNSSTRYCTPVFFADTNECDVTVIFVSDPYGVYYDQQQYLVGT